MRVSAGWIVGISGVNAGGAGGSYQDIDNRKVDRAVASYDLPQIFNLASSYELPFGRGRYVNYSNALRETFPADLERDLEEGAVGWKYMPVFYGFLADNRGFLPGYEVCRRQKASIIIDLCNWLIGPNFPLYNEIPDRQKAVKCLEDYARLLDPVFSAFPTVPVLLAHRGTPRDDKDFVVARTRELLDSVADAIGGVACYGKCSQCSRRSLCALTWFNPVGPNSLGQTRFQT